MIRSRIGILGLLHESNTFVGGRTGLDRFHDDLFLRGRDIPGAMEGASHEVGGFLAALSMETDVEIVPLFFARALPSGVLERDAFESLWEEMDSALAAAGPLDGILAAAHGATVAESATDADGEWLGRLRQRVGPDVPVVATIDPHANLSPAMVEVTDALLAYRTNPHLDQQETGRRAARLILRTLRNEVAPVQAAAFPPMAINIQSQATADDPLRSCIEAVSAEATQPGIVEQSLILGFPYADVPEMGSAVLAVADGDPDLAGKVADRMGRVLWEQRAEFEPPFLSVAEGVRRASHSGRTPVVLLDMGDNVGGGTPGNLTAIARCWIEEGRGRGFVCLHDADAARRATEAGVGSTIPGPVGESRHALSGLFVVESLADGRFREEENRHGGFRDCDQGRTAILETGCGRLAIMVTERRMAPFSLRQLTAFGVDPGAFRMIVAKGVIAPRAAYAEVALGGFLAVDSPGPSRADMTRMDYRHRRRPLFPFEPDADWPDR